MDGPVGLNEIVLGLSRTSKWGNAIFAAAV